MASTVMAKRISRTVIESHIFQVWPGSLFPTARRTRLRYRTNRGRGQHAQRHLRLSKRTNMVNMKSLKRQATKFLMDRLIAVFGLDRIAGQAVAAWTPVMEGDHRQKLTARDKEVLDTLAREALDYVDLREVLTWKLEA